MMTRTTKQNSGISKEIVVHKCSADRPRGCPLRDDDDVYYLTWLIAWTKDECDAQMADADWFVVDHKLKLYHWKPLDYWSYVDHIAMFVIQWRSQDFLLD